MIHYHIPVMLAQAVEYLNLKPGGRYIDATFGFGGHSREILNRNAQVLGIEADNEAILRFKNNFQENLSGLTLVRGNFKNLIQIAKSHKFRNVDGILFDLGVSSFQLDNPGKGFSFRFDESPIDLRFDQSEGQPAYEILNTYNREELYEIFTKFGEEERSGAIADAIVRTRSVINIKNVKDLKTAFSKYGLNLNPNQYARIFQALRIEVNSELENLKSALNQSRELLKTNGRLVVMSYHSLEDRIVKQFMDQIYFTKITKKPIRADYEEITKNTRSRSVRMRVAEKI